MDGVFLSVQAHALAERILSRRCSGVGAPFPGGLALAFGECMLILSSRPDSPSMWVTDSRDIPDPSSPVWKRHLEGSTVTGILQQGADRVLHVQFSSGQLYGTGDVRLIFEATGRNANLILVRTDDNRILGCHRRIPQNRCRYRTITPGKVYMPPPASGLPPGEWSESAELAGAIGCKQVQPSDIYSLLEGVGPATASALIHHSRCEGISVNEAILMLERALLNREFLPWMSLFGPMPVRLGPEGEPIPDPLSEDMPGSSRGIRRDRLETLRSLIGRKINAHGRRLVAQKNALGDLVDPDVLRMWGNLLISSENNGRRGLSSIKLTDWNGTVHEIPLRISRTLVENAQRYFRKAANVLMERDNLQKHIQSTEGDLLQLEGILAEAESLTSHRIDEILTQHSIRAKLKKSKVSDRAPIILRDGWRCYVGRNARDNDEITFGIGRKGDLWFHARGLPGAHVLIKRDGRLDNPSAEVILEAAVAAARSSRIYNGVVPVDYTGVQYVNRMRKGKPGQVVYTREKTIFVDLDNLPAKKRITRSTAG